MYNVVSIVRGKTSNFELRLSPALKELIPYFLVVTEAFYCADWLPLLANNITMSN